jgi:hypothetical protein
VLLILFFKAFEGRISFWEAIKEGVYFAIPLFSGSALGVMIGKIIGEISHLGYYKFGQTSIEWGTSGAFKTMVVENLDRYFLRAIVYYPIAVFGLAFLAFGVILVYTMIEKKIAAFVLGVAVCVSLFLVSLIRCNYMWYRTAQSITIFIGVVFFFVLDKLSYRIKK